MRIVIRLLLTVSLGILLSSCSKIIYISKRIDPEIILDKEKHSIVFVNLFDYTLSENIKQKDKLSFHNAVMGLLEGLSSFSSDTSFNFVVGDTLKKDIGAGMLTTLLPVDSVSAICNRNNSNMLLALDSVNIFFDLETTPEEDNFGYRGNTKNFYINTRFFLSLYSITGDLINRSELDQSTFYRSRPTLSGSVAVVPSVERAREDIGELAFQSGLDYVSKFYPQMTQDTQELYSGKPFSDSNRYIFSRDWKKAAELLDELTKNSDPVVAEKAKHNLEVVREAASASER